MIREASLFLCLCLGLNTTLLAQDSTINLIPNPSFEDANICTKYHEACYPEAWHSTTLKAFYYLNDEKSKKNKAVDGHRMVSICMHNSKRAFDRGFLQTPLLCELEAGKSYNLSFYYRTPFRMLKRFGIQFTDTLLIHKKNDHLQGLEPSITFDQERLIPANTWIKVKATYTAKGGERVLIIGNFQQDANTQITELKKPKKENYDNRQARTYYLFDAFQLTPLDPKITCDLEAEQALIYANNTRHTFPKAEDAEVTSITQPEVIEEPVEPTFLVIEEDSIIISEVFELPNILFDTNSDQLLPVAYPVLKKLATHLLFNRKDKLIITGHTDNVGSPLANQNLSERRAKAVHDFLLREGIFKNRITFLGKGESEPIDSNDTEMGRSNNRRVTFELKQ